MSSKAESKWISLAEAPSTRNSFVSDPKHDALYSVAGGELYKFSGKNNKWYEVATIDDGLSFISWNTIAMNTATNTLFVDDQEGSMAILELGDNIDNANKCKIIHGLTPTGSGSQGIIINNEFHVMAGRGHKKHSKFNESTNTLDIVHNLGSDLLIPSLDGHRVVKVENDTRILLFGGILNYEASNLIYEYNILQNEWNLLSFTMPKGRSSFGCISVLNGKYVVLFGGSCYDWTFSRDRERYLHDDIWIYYVKSKRFVMSDIKCPEKGGFEAVKMNDHKLDEITVTGYVRNTWNEFKISSHLFPPNYLIKVMQRYFMNEYVHLFQKDSGDWDLREYKHWKMNLFDIISTIE